VRALVIGSGGREHAFVRALADDPGVDEVHAAPGNPGMAEHGPVHAVDPLDGSAVTELAGGIGADLVIVGPEAPLVAGVADAVRAAGIACFGPTAAAAKLEGSKAFAKQVMAGAGVPTAMAHVCDTPAEAEDALDAFGPPYVVKDDGLAAGKGVLVTSDRQAALEHAGRCECVVIEEYLDGPEVSLFGLSDGTTVLPLQPAQDFKRLADGDAGPNTGGMGAYTPLPWLPAGFADEVAERVLRPTVDEMHRGGTPFQGLLYAGLALTSRGVRVVEFNVRFGDPETQPLLALLRTPLGVLLSAVASGRLADVPDLRWHDGAAVSVVLAAPGYPQAPRTGDAIDGVESAAALPGVQVSHAGTALDEAGRLVTAGGRVLTVTGTGADVEDARQRAYDGVAQVSFAGQQHRGDIAAGAGSAPPWAPSP
jgi:phosphoribosylamine--glycine ligase